MQTDVAYVRLYHLLLRDFWYPVDLRGPRLDGL